MPRLLQTPLNCNTTHIMVSPSLLAGEGQGRGVSTTSRVMHHPQPVPPPQGGRVKVK
ncbi:protein of unknown function [Hyphomicrobium sp. 1Nfss2.1]